jgi:hypothetical protein
MPSFGCCKVTSVDIEENPFEKGFFLKLLS